MDNNTKLLNERIESLFEELASLQPGSEEYAKVSDDLNKMYKLRIEEIKIQNEDDEHYARRCMDKEFHEQEMVAKGVESKGHMVERFVKLGLECAAIFVPCVVYGHWMRECLMFEKEDSFSHTTSRNLLNRFKPW